MAGGDSMITIIIRGETPDILTDIPAPRQPPHFGAMVRVVRAGPGLVKSKERFLGMGRVTRVSKGTYDISTIRMSRVDFGETK